MRENIVDTRSIHFRQFWVTLDLVAEKPPQWGEIFWHQIYPFQAISSNFGFGGRKATPPPQMREKILTPDLSISGNFEQLWFLWHKSPPPPRWGKKFWHQIYPFQAISSPFGFGSRKAATPSEGNFLTPDLSISGNFVQLWFWWQKSPPPPNEGKFFDTRSIHFRQLWATLVLVAVKHPPQWEKNFWHQIYPFQTIMSNFGFGGRKAPPDEGKFFDTRSIHFRQFWATLVLVAEEPPPPFLPFRERPDSYHTCRIPMVPILQIHTQIPPIQISSIGYQLCLLFKILTYTEVQDTGLWCRWKAYRQPYHNTH